MSWRLWDIELLILICSKPAGTLCYALLEQCSLNNVTRMRSCWFSGDLVVYRGADFWGGKLLVPEFHQVAEKVLLEQRHLVLNQRRVFPYLHPLWSNNSGLSLLLFIMQAFILGKHFLSTHQLNW
jgi:hypothetical protein